MSFFIGQRVRIKEGAWEFAGVTGTIEPPPSGVLGLDRGRWIGPHKLEKRRQGAVLLYWVTFDEPTDDGSGDGPYLGAGIAEEDLEPLTEFM